MYKSFHGHILLIIDNFQLPTYEMDGPIQNIVRCRFKNHPIRCYNPLVTAHKLTMPEFVEHAYWKLKIHWIVHCLYSFFAFYNEFFLIKIENDFINFSIYNCKNYDCRRYTYAEFSCFLCRKSRFFTIFRLKTATQDNSCVNLKLESF